MHFLVVFSVFVINTAICFAGNEGFSFASYYSNSMVLQSAPQKCTIWGYGTADSTVNVTVNYKDSYVTKVNSGGKWMVTIGPYNAIANSVGNIITATENGQSKLTLTDVLFGEVWGGSGQSNMEMGIGLVYNSSFEISHGRKYENIRLLGIKRNISNVTLENFNSYFTQWTKTTPDALNTSASWGGFSALCFLYGVRLYDKLKVPIGLIESAYGGTMVEAWSSKDVTRNCEMEPRMKQYTYESIGRAPPHTLWNGMIAPLLSFTIKGFIWYQGESNVLRNSKSYSCMFPGMITDWRKKWFAESNGTTIAEFPFGFVQLAGSLPQPYDGWSKLRWDQTSGFGYVPNIKMKNTFMAVATDLTDSLSPVRSIHPRDKQTIADRLSWAAFNQVYHKTEYPLHGPKVVKEIISNKNRVSLLILFYDQNITLVSNDIFSFECVSGGWQDALATQVSNKEIILQLPHNCEYYKFAYLWKQTPCIYKKCAVYSADEWRLPAPTWLWTFETLQNPQNHTKSTSGSDMIHSGFLLTILLFLSIAVLL